MYNFEMKRQITILFGPHSSRVKETCFQKSGAKTKLAFVFNPQGIYSSRRNQQMQLSMEVNGRAVEEHHTSICKFILTAPLPSAAVPSPKFTRFNANITMLHHTTYSPDLAHANYLLFL